MLVTSTPEVGRPSASDLIFSFLNDGLDNPKIFLRKAVILREADLGVNPEFRLPFRTLNMNVTLRFFPGEE